MGTVLTAASVMRLKPNPRKRLEVPDAIVPGLYLVIQPSGVKSWAVRYRHRGQPRKLTIGRLGVFDLAEAREQARTTCRPPLQGGIRARTSARVGERRRTATAISSRIMLRPFLPAMCARRTRRRRSPRPSGASTSTSCRVGVSARCRRSVGATLSGC